MTSADIILWMSLFLFKNFISAYAILLLGTISCKIILFTFVLKMHFNVIFSYLGCFLLLFCFFSHFFHTLYCWPIDTITNRFSTSTEYWKRPEIRINSKNLSKVISFTNVVLTFVISSLFIKTFDSCFIIKH